MIKVKVTFSYPLEHSPLIKSFPGINNIYRDVFYDFKNALENMMHG